MHIPDGFLDTKTIIATSALASAGVALAWRKTKSEVIPQRVPLLGVAAAFVFAAQMLNFPVAGGTSGHLIGATLAQTGYVRNREQEFISKGVERKYLVAQLEELIQMINETVNAITPEQMEAEYPIFFDKPKTSTSYVLLQLLLHLNYHLGQVNYLRRIIE